MGLESEMLKYYYLKSAIAKKLINWFLFPLRQCLRYCCILNKYKNYINPISSNSAISSKTLLWLRHLQWYSHTNKGFPNYKTNLSLLNMRFLKLQPKSQLKNIINTLLIFKEFKSTNYALANIFICSSPNIWKFIIW